MVLNSSRSKFFPIKISKEKRNQKPIYLDNFQYYQDNNKMTQQIPQHQE